MTTSHLDYPPPAEPPLADRRPQQATWPTVVEVLGSMAAVGAIVALVLNWLSVHLVFFGVDVVVEPEDVRNYWVIVTVLALSLVAVFAGAASRPARGAWVWHLLVAGLGALAAVLLAVTTVGPVVDHPAPPRPAYTGPRCYSGGDGSGCPGG